jgi:hypothetical protein
MDICTAVEGKWKDKWRATEPGRDPAREIDRLPEVCGWAVAGLDI